MFLKQKSIFILLLIIGHCVFAQQLKTNYKFDFGNGKAAIGYTKVSTIDIYNNITGFGFEPGATIIATNNKGKDLLTSDFIGSEKPFSFSVKLPEGNYNVKVIMGDLKGTSSATIRVENRRLMVPMLSTTQGAIVTKAFTVHMRDTLIGSTGKYVKIKPRERAYLHWDNKMTFEFNGPNPKICGLEITPANKDVITVFLAGNSTVVDQPDDPWAAWGQMLPSFFQPEKVVVANYAESGETAHSFIGERRLDKVLSLMNAGDYLFIEFAHNDQKEKGSGVGAFTTYKKDLKFYISEARKKGGIPILVTSMNRRNFDSAGQVIMTLGDYPAAMRQTAQEENVQMIDLNYMSKRMYETWGPEESKKAFVVYPANTFPNQPKALEDNTHFNPYGAYEIARCIVHGMQENKIALANYLKKDIVPFNPAQPDAIPSFIWPFSPKANAVKPDGN